MEQDKARLMKRFKIKDLGDIKQVLGIRVSRDRSQHTLKLDQEQYLSRVLRQYGFTECRTEPTPEASSKQQGPAQLLRSGPRDEELEQLHPQVTASNFSSVVGALLYAANSTRPDIAHAVNMLTRVVAQPTAQSLLALKRVLRYIAGTLSHGLTYSAGGIQPLRLQAYSDADWAGDASDARSTSGVLFMLANAAVQWVSQKQSNVACSSSEAEYIAASEAARENYHLRVLLADIGAAQPESTLLHIDNQTAMRMALEEGNRGRRKHINVRHHYLREQVAEGYLELQWIPTASQPADVLTKPVDRATFFKHQAFIMN